MLALLQWHMVYKLGEDELHRPNVVALNNSFGMGNLHIMCYQNFITSQILAYLPDLSS